jgi:hypothetical protein
VFASLFLFVLYNKTLWIDCLFYAQNRTPNKLSGEGEEAAVEDHPEQLQAMVPEDAA